MKTIMAICVGMWTRVLPFVVMFGCATAPPTELVSARAKYSQAAASPEGKAAPVELHKARVALDRAEQSFAARAKPETRDFAYVAERKTETAQAAGSTALAEGERQVAEAVYDKRQGQLLEGARSDLGKTREQLAESGRTQQAMAADLNVERTARAEADSKAAASKQEAAAANEALAKLAAKEEQRGLVITLSGSVLFASGKYALLNTAMTKLDQVAEALKAQDTDKRMVVEGHTDSQGSDKVNQPLSLNRGNTVRDYLVSRGVASEKITAVGMGSTRPLVDNKSAENRANNRRVEIVISVAPISAR